MEKRTRVKIIKKLAQRTTLVMKMKTKTWENTRRYVNTINNVEVRKMKKFVSK